MSLVWQLHTYASTLPGLENTLRLLQAICILISDVNVAHAVYLTRAVPTKDAVTTVAARTVTTSAATGTGTATTAPAAAAAAAMAQVAPCLRMAHSLSLSRRYLRCTAFVGVWARAEELLVDGLHGGGGGHHVVGKKAGGGGEYGINDMEKEKRKGEGEQREDGKERQPERKTGGKENNDGTSAKGGSGGESDRLLSLLEGVRLALLGMYLFLELLTTPDAVSAFHYPIAKQLWIEACRFWFASIATGIVRGLLQLMLAVTTMSEQTKEEKGSKNKNENEGGEEKETETETTEPKHPPQSTTTTTATATTTKTFLFLPLALSNPPLPLLADLFISALDLLIPGTQLGWTPVPPAVVSAGQVTTSLLVGRRRWGFIQAEAPARGVLA